MDYADHTESDPIQTFQNMSIRLQSLLECVEILKGWDSEASSVFVCVKDWLCEAKTNMKKCKKHIENIKNGIARLEEQRIYLSSLKQKSRYLENNLPLRFNKVNPTVDTTQVQHKTAEIVHQAQTPKVKTVSTVPGVQYLTQKEFQSIPKYMKGRLTYEQINTFIDKFNSVLSKKYAILKKKKTSLKKHDADLWVKFKSQETPDLKGLFFCVANDFQTLDGSVIDRVGSNLLTILRHCGRMREVRTSGIVRYVAMY